MQRQPLVPTRTVPPPPPQIESQEEAVRKASNPVALRYWQQCMSPMSTTSSKQTPRPEDSNKQEKSSCQTNTVLPPWLHPDYPPIPPSYNLPSNTTPNNNPPSHTTPNNNSPSHTKSNNNSPRYTTPNNCKLIHNTTGYNTTNNNTPSWNTVRNNTISRNTASRNTVNHNTVSNNTVNHNTVSNNTVSHDTATQIRGRPARDTSSNLQQVPPSYRSPPVRRVGVMTVTQARATSLPPWSRVVGGRQGQAPGGQDQAVQGHQGHGHALDKNVDSLIHYHQFKRYK